MSEVKNTCIVKKEPFEEEGGKELKYFQTIIKAEPCFQEIPESNPSSELKETEDFPMEKVPDPGQQTVDAATSYSSETIVKEELIIEDCGGFLEISKSGLHSELKDKPNAAEVTSYSSETIVKEELIIEDSSESLLESLDEDYEEGESDKSKISSSDKKAWFCDKCNKSFNRRQTYYNHRKRHFYINSRKYSCKFCEKPFSSQTDLGRHEMALHTKNSGRSEKANRTWQCHLCPTMCDSNDSYRSHLSTHEQQVLSMFRCEHCSRCFGDQESVQNHVETGQCSKLPKQILEEENGLFKCCECNQAFTLRRSCVQHTKRHFAFKNKTFQCATCGSLHGTHSELRRHARAHGLTPQKWKKRRSSTDSRSDQPNIYRCSECPKTFLDRAGCDRHIKRHESLRNGEFQCNECGKCYGRQTELRKHLLAHEKKRAKVAAS